MATTLTQRVQILLDDAQYRELVELAKARGKPVSVLLREAVVDLLLRDARRTARRKAFEQIASLALPVADWPEMEREIERAHVGSREPS